MIKFIKRIFTKKEKEMFSKSEIEIIKSKIDTIKQDLNIKRKKNQDKVLEQACKSLEKTLNHVLSNLDDINELENPKTVSYIKKSNLTK